MNIVRLPKRRRGEFRVIYVPNKQEKESLRQLLPEVVIRMEKACNLEVVHGFARGRSPVTNALAHVGFPATLSMDLADFFDSVSARHVEAVLSEVFVRQVIVDGSARQGLPTSPAVANIAAAKMDADILASLRRMVGDTSGDPDTPRFVYTRYADDLSISFRVDNDASHRAFRSLAKDIAAEVASIAQRHGFRLNERKTTLQLAAFGRRIITGVAVSETGVHPTREAKRRLRAARHKGAASRSGGLEEWCALRLPRAYRRE